LAEIKRKIRELLGKGGKGGMVWDSEAAHRDVRILGGPARPKSTGRSRMVLAGTSNVGEFAKGKKRLGKKREQEAKKRKRTSRQGPPLLKGEGKRGLAIFESRGGKRLHAILHASFGVQDICCVVRNVSWEDLFEEIMTGKTVHY